MDFRIADTFTDSLARLTGEEQKAVKTTAFDLQVNPASPGLHFHKLDGAKDKNFWSVRVNADIRIIVHRTPGSLLLCYVDHHAFEAQPSALRPCRHRRAEIAAVAAWLRQRADEGFAPHEIGLFVRSEAELERAYAAANRAGLPFKVLDEHVDIVSGRLAISTMHLAKGLEFRAVAVTACDDEIIPLQSRIESVSDEADLEEVYNTERHLLYVACTRARDRLLVTSGDVPSEFLDDLGPRLCR